MNTVKVLVLVAILVVLTPVIHAAAIAPIPEEDGFSGFINVGGAYMRVKSNTIAGTRFFDLGDDRLSNVNSSPGSEEVVTPLINGEFRYTWADSRTQLFLGNGLADWIRFDFTTALGVRQEVGDAGIAELSYLFSAMPTKVWKDPYVNGAKRDDTDRDSSGARLGWSKIMGSNAHLRYSYRDIDVDTELSGTFLGLPAAQAGLLERDGTEQQVEFLYIFQLAENQWLAPTLYYTYMDLDGEAMKNNRYGLQLTYTYAFSERFRLVTNLSYAMADFDERNPIYNKTRDDDRYGASIAGFYDRLFDVENLTGVLSAAYWREDSNIDFYDTDVIAVTASTMFRF